MLRLGNTRPLHWADKTMSVLRANQLEACEKYLAGLPCRSLFDADCTDADAETFYELSYDAPENRDFKKVKTELHTIQQLRETVLSRFAAEMSLLSPEEHDLLVKLILLGGSLTLQDWNDFAPARCLVRRLWCKVSSENNTITLMLPRQLCATGLILLAADGHKAIRDIVERVTENVDDTLYLMGMMQITAPLRDLENRLKDTVADNHPELIRRFLMTSNDYIYDPEGHLLLIHPGLAEPDRMLALFDRSNKNVTLTEDALNAASDSLSTLENPLYEQMLGQISGAVRPEMTPEDAVEDLIILAKQDVPFRDMQEVLSSLLICQPDREMDKALKNLYDRIPRWFTLSTAQVQ